MTKPTAGPQAQSRAPCVWLPSSQVWAHIRTAKAPRQADSSTGCWPASSQSAAADAPGRSTWAPSRAALAQAASTGAGAPAHSGSDAVLAATSQPGPPQTGGEPQGKGSASALGGQHAGGLSAAHGEQQHTGFALADARPAEPAEEEEEEQHEPLPTCPICLAHIYDLRQKAVVLGCFHTFCIACLTRWARQKRVCPMCKGRIRGFMYDIRSDTEYKERILPPSPARPPAASEAHRVALLDTVVAARPAAAAALPSAGGGGARRSTRHRAEPDAHRSGAAEPRPYFWRVRQGLAAGAAARCSAGSAPRRLPEVRSLPEERALAWRRHLYQDHLRALPLDTSSLGAVAPTATRERRLSEWVDRELRALLEQDDVTIVRSFVMGLVAAYGLEDAATSAPPAAQPEHGAAGAGRVPPGQPRSRDPVAALQPFLHEHSEHFWHELRCFARAPYSMQTYDRVVQYVRTCDQPQHSHARPASLSRLANGVPATVPTSEWALWSSRQGQGPLGLSHEGISAAERPRPASSAASDLPRRASATRFADAPSAPLRQQQYPVPHLDRQASLRRTPSPVGALPRVECSASQAEALQQQRHAPAEAQHAAAAGGSRTRSRSRQRRRQSPLQVPRDSKRRRPSLQVQDSCKAQSAGNEGCSEPECRQAQPHQQPTLASTADALDRWPMWGEDC